MKGFATIQEVEKADKDQLARWYRFRFPARPQRTRRSWSRSLSGSRNWAAWLPNLARKLGC